MRRKFPATVGMQHGATAPTAPTGHRGIDRLGDLTSSALMCSAML
jgi:hypothetical protein